MQPNHLINHSKVLQSIQKIEKSNPLVLSLTNHVVMNFTANALLSIGASPLMSLAADEMDELVNISHAVVINIGTLNSCFLECSFEAAKAAIKYKKPVILDPVGVGASQLRSQAVQDILETGAVTLLKGNASEVIAIGNLTSPATSKGVDSSHSTDEAIASAIEIAKKYKICVAITGPTDVVVNEQYIGYIDLNVPMMTKVTGTGCTAAALCGAFSSCDDDAFVAAFSTLFTMSLVGNEAQKQTKAPGSFATAFIDGLSQITPEMVMNMSGVFIEEH
ncbi:MAG: hydroxyethylthiazole kinase [Alphaproteobacteria bacterium]